jgi:hypothetical protein
MRKPSGLTPGSGIVDIVSSVSRSQLRAILLKEEAEFQEPDRKRAWNFHALS